MKLNGISNIITDQDVTVTDLSHIGDSLHSVVSDFDSRIKKLEEQEKWIYANGGIGNASGGGGGSSTRWQIKGSLDNVELSSGSIVALTQGIGVYELKLYTSGGSGTYSVTYTYGTNSSRTVTLNADNGWSTSASIRITENGRLSIIASDGNIRREITAVQYIVIPYDFKAPALYKDDGSPYPTGNSDLFIEEAQLSGIHIKAQYSIAVSGTFIYKWFLDGVQVSEETAITNDVGIIDYNIPKSFIVNENAALHSYQLQISIKPTGTIDPIIQTLNGSFNLIPKDLYLKISPSLGQVIYDQEVEDAYEFNTNTSIALTIRVYNGINATGNLGTVTWTVLNNDGTTGLSESKTITDGVSYQINTYFTQPGWNRLRFEYSLNEVGTGVPVIKYFYCKESQSGYNWFHGKHNPEDRRFYIPQALSDETKLYGLSNIDSENVPLYIEKRTSDELPTSFKIENYSNGDQTINIGIQYNNINNIEKPIIKLYSDDNKSEESITIYQNYIEFGKRFFDSPQSCNIFLHKERKYDSTDLNKYHLITISCASAFYLNENEGTLIGNNTYYELSVYIDGILEGTVSSKPTRSPELHYIDLMPGNYAINHIDIARFVEKRGYRTMFDSDINWYWNSYRSRLNLDIDEAETQILESLFDVDSEPTYYIENQLVKVNEGLPNNVAISGRCPVLVVTLPRDIATADTTTNIYDWLNRSYVDGSGDILAKLGVRVTNIQWSPGHAELKEVDIPKNEYFGQNTYFTIALQGSSTMSNKSKNFTLAIKPDDSISTANESILFSPNYIKGDSSTFLPERAFTLKADVVDSSHSNNTAVGKFINDNNNWDYKSMQRQTGSQEILSHVKQCLEGFSMVMFLNVTYKDQGGADKLDCYYLGIYNFNLGRDSYFNLGYSDLSQLDPEELTASTNNGFTFCKVGGIKDGVVQNGINPLPGFIAAEVQDNSPFWDFSQYDTSILFPITAEETGDFMFGDIVTSATTRPVVEERIQQFVKSVAAAGGYLFKLIGKEFIPSDTQENGEYVVYHAENKVPDYKIQYTKTRVGTNVIYTPGEGDLDDNLSEGALTDCILDNLDEEKIAKLDYASVVYYYLTCMIFGLVDSVQKNLNIKTWTADTANSCKTGLFFYDMDTCLGKTNSGGKTSYFTFSDFWKSEIIKYDANGDIIPESDKITQAVRIVNNGIKNYRDCFLYGTNVTGYDTPSSYLFAIAKYAQLSDSVMASYGNVFPQYLYAKWRGKNGILKNADIFIDNYFASNLENIPNCLINLNYRNKYLFDYAEHAAGFVASTSLHGTGIEETRDWLTGRLHILDAYFNINQATVVIYQNLQERLHGVDVSGNDDIYLLSDIFSINNETIGRKSSLNFVINADDYSPLCVRLGSSYKWYLFEDSKVNYETNIPVTGVLQTTFGGSQLWRSIDSINSFVESRDKTDSIFVFNSDQIDTLIGDSGVQLGNWDIHGPSLKTINLTGNNYTGTLRVDNTFYSLNQINISNSAISLDISDSGIKSINASNLRGSGLIKIIDCHNLQTVNLENSLITDCQIQPTWTSNLDFSNVYAKNITLKTPDEGILTINRNSTVSNIILSNFETVNIDNCAYLSSVSCTESTLNTLRTLKVTNCNNLTRLVVYSNVLETLDLRGCTKLEEITLHGSDFSHLKILNVSNTLLKKIVFDDLPCEDGIFDFSRFTLLAKSSDKTESYLNISNNKNLKSIQFDTSDSVYLHYTFSGCENLERLYGIFYINCSNCFYRCYKFSVHGADLTNLKWNNKNIINNNRVQHPRELYNSPETYKPTAVGLTSMFFNGNYAASAFRETNCTIFDMYYLLWNCTPSIMSLDYMFYLNKNTTWGRFSWTSTADNSPNKLMFQNCGSVISMNSTFYVGGSNGPIRLFSPDHDEYDDIVSDNGLFSPLVNLTTWSYVFYTYSTVIDRFVFRRTSGDYKISSMDRCLESSYIVDDVNNVSFANSTTSEYVTGNLTRFFDNLQRLSGVVSGLLYRTNTIDFSTISNIPNNINTLRSCFVCSYGTGEIDFNEYFNNTLLNNIYQSFIADATKANCTEPFINLTNNTFDVFVPRSGYNGLINFGYDNSNTNYRGNTSLNGTLTGIKRILPNDVFPWDIFEELRGLKMMCSLFRGCSPVDSTISNLKLPGNLFTNNTVLEDCSGLFYDLKYPYTISPTHDIFYGNSYGISRYSIVEREGSTFNNFINCHNLKDVSYLFGATVVGTETEYPALTGMIPNNLFWHGVTVDSVSITGANERTEILDENDQPTGEYNYSEISENLLKISVNSTITNMEGCFQACNCSAYEKFKNDGDVAYFEDNPNWSPFLYVKNNKGKWISNANYNTQKYTAIWIYDGRNRFEYIQSNNIENLDFVDWDLFLDGGNRKYVANASTWRESGDSIVQIRETFMCPPDLLRFCTDSANISKLFNGSGLHGMNSIWQVSQDLNHDKYAYGIEGRICPYLLKPVSNTKSVEKMFSQCKRLSFIHDYELDKDILIPDDFFKYATKVSNLKNMFDYMVQPHKLDMRNIFSKLTQSLEIDSIFYNNYWSTEEEQTVIEEVFRKNTISSLVGCFRIAGDSTNDSQPRNQYVKFKNIFKDRTYNTPSYADNSKFSFAFYGYRRTYPDFTEEKTLVDNTVTNNYITIV